jgi:uncharacterized UPF0160 family protein
METSGKKLITHDGAFHSDDIFACATLSLKLAKDNIAFEIIRTRDPEIIKQGDYVFDVGGIYDDKLNRFDHHQVGGAGKHDATAGEPGIEYASFGLVWMKFGVEICKDQKIVDLIEKKLVVPVDAADNGFDLVTNKYDISQYLIQNAFSSMRPTWREENITDDEMFLKCVEIAKEILSREIIQTRDGILAEEIIIDTYRKTADKRVIILDKDYPFEITLGAVPEPLFVISPRRNTDNLWAVKAVRADPGTFKNRKNLPESWAGLRDEELQKISGVSDAIFCHRALFLAVAKSKEGAIKLAQIAVES